jgi:basic amino acid/polyamine antiporter, APA family
MSQRRLKRQLGLGQVVMLGTAGTIAAAIFVLTGHTAGMVGPASVLALLVIGILSYSIALNYCELGTAFPVTGGAMTYVREAFGTNLLSFLVGSLDCLSSTFFSALSAVGFAYSLRVFLPFIPIVPTALVVILIFTVLNLFGVSNVGGAQILLGGVLLGLLVIYVVAGLILPQGFSWQTFVPDGRFFVHEGFWANVARMLGTIALVYNAYIGFEVIADDAEEVEDPNHNLPRGILISLTVIIVIYALVSLITLGTISWTELAGSETALTDAASRFLPGWGAPLMAIAGIIATLTTVNTAMLSATREAFTLSRDGAWPRAMSRLGRFRTPYIAILVIGMIIAFIASIGLVTFLSYISSSGYLFVLFWASLAMIRLRQSRPELKRPFRVPLFPLTPIVAAAICLLMLIYTDWQALLFGVALLAVLTVFYYLYRPVTRVIAEGVKAIEPDRDRILVPVANPQTAEGLVRLAAILAECLGNTSVTILGVIPVKRRMLPSVAHEFLSRLGREQRRLLSRIVQDAEQHNVPLYTKVAAAPSITEGILEEVENYGRDSLILMGWPSPPDPESLAINPVSQVLARAHTNIAVFLNRGITGLNHILVPVGGSIHSLLAVRLATELGEQTHARVTALRCFCEPGTEDLHDDLMLLREQIQMELGEVPAHMTTKVLCSRTVAEGISAELAQNRYDLVVMGSAIARSIQADLFGSLTDRIAEEIPCSVLLAHRYEPAAIAWLRRRVKRMMGD